MKKNKQVAEDRLDVEFYLPTKDDCYPNFIRDTDRTHLFEYPVGHPGHKDPITVMFRIFVSGEDDTFLGNDFYFPRINLVQARKEMQQKLRDLPNPLNKDWLLSYGYHG